MEVVGVDLGSLLGAVEESPPLDAVEVLAGELVRVLGARHVALLITSLSGTSLVRLSHVVGSAPTAGRNERAEMLSLGGRPTSRSC